MKKLVPAQRLIVAADFKPEQNSIGGRNSVRGQVLRLVDRLAGTGVCLKVNSALRACGYSLIKEIRDNGKLQVFADLKLNDISETLLTDGELLAEYKPEIVTVMCGTGTTSMHSLKEKLPDTEVLGVTVLTSLKNMDPVLFGYPVEDAVDHLARVAHRAKIDGLVAAATEIPRLRNEYFAEHWPGMTINTPGIRPKWAEVANDDQNTRRVMTPGDAIRAGADRIVVGRPIVQADNPKDAVMRTLEEIEGAMVAA